MDRDTRERDGRQAEERTNRGSAANRRQSGNNQEYEYALDELVQIIGIILTDESRPVPMNRQKRIVDVDKAMHFVESMKRQMPGEIIEARHICEERDSIIDSAQRRADSIFKEADDRARVVMEDAQKSAQAAIADAENRAAQIIEDAQNRARALVDQNEVRRVAENEAKRLINDAREKARNVTGKANEYADAVLAELERFVGEELNAIRTSRASTRPGARDANSGQMGPSGTN